MQFKQALVPLESRHRFQNTSIGNQLKSSLEQGKIDEQAHLGVGVGNSRFVKHCGRASADHVCPKPLCSQQTADEIAARRKEGAERKQQRHIDGNPVLVKVKRGEKHKQQTCESEQ